MHSRAGTYLETRPNKCVSCDHQDWVGPPDGHMHRRQSGFKLVTSRQAYSVAPTENPGVLMILDTPLVLYKL